MKKSFMNYASLASGLVSLAASGFANAALDPAIGTNATSIGADALTLGGIVLVLVVGIAMFKHLRSAK